jgi:hypothetical protein
VLRSLAGAGARVCETSSHLAAELQKPHSLLVEKGPLAMLLQRACDPTCATHLDGTIKTVRVLRKLEPLTLGWPKGCVAKRKRDTFRRPCVHPAVSKLRARPRDDTLDAERP